jgi:hypothetical protein
MRHLLTIVIVMTMGCVLCGASASAQIAPQNPVFENSIPAPLPPPPSPPVINGPLSQGPAPGVDTPPELNTFSDRATQCSEQGSNGGLRGAELDAYTSSCANAN